jgi:hypothetical protein
MFSKNFISIYFLTFVIFFFLNYSFVEIFDEDLIIISCFFFIFFLLKNILTNIFIKEIDSRILIVKEQFISILNLKKKFILDNFINYSEFNIFIINSTFYFFFYLSKFFNFVSVEKIIEVKKLWNNFFLYYLSINNTIEVLYIKTKSVDILRNLNIKN